MSGLPANAFAFLYAPDLDIGGCIGPDLGDHWFERFLARRLSAVATAIQGMTFDVADLPPSLPAAHLLCPLLAGFGVHVDTVAIAMPPRDRGAGEAASIDKAGDRLDPNGPGSRRDPGETELAALHRIRAMAALSADVRYGFPGGTAASSVGGGLPIVTIAEADGARRTSGMTAVYGAAPVSHPAARAQARRAAAAMLRRVPLISKPAREWRPPPTSGDTRTSVIVPVEGDATGLAPTLASLARVTGPAPEIVIIDHGSSDAALVQRIVDSFSPIARLVRTGRIGEAAACNRGLEATSADCVSVVACGDHIAPPLFAAALAALDATPAATGACSHWDVIDAAGFAVHRHDLPEFDRRLLVQAHWCFPGSAPVLRRAALEAIGGWDTTYRFLAQYDLLLRLTRLGPLEILTGRFGRRRLGRADAATRLERAAEHVRVVDRLLDDPEEPTMTAAERERALAAARLAAVTVLGAASGNPALTDPGVPHLATGKLRQGVPPPPAAEPATGRPHPASGANGRWHGPGREAPA